MTFHKRLTTTIAPALAAAMLLIAAPVATTAQTEAPAPVTIGDERLEAFVAALRTVDQLEQQYTETLSQAETDAEREAVIAEANEAMTTAIEETPGISLDEYVTILQQAQTDPDLTARIMALLEG
ncbi:MAG: DUF4168 domain-containing protein [Pararhodobacter sp.]